MNRYPSDRVTLSTDFNHVDAAELAAVLDYIRRVAEGRPYEGTVGADEFAARYLRLAGLIDVADGIAASAWERADDD